LKDGITSFLPGVMGSVFAPGYVSGIKDNPEIYFLRQSDISGSGVRGGQHLSWKCS